MAFKEIIGKKVMHTCDICDRLFQMGQGLYEGTYLSELEITVCKICGPSDQTVGERKLTVKRIRELISRRAEERATNDKGKLQPPA